MAFPFFSATAAAAAAPSGAWKCSTAAGVRARACQQATPARVEVASSSLKTNQQQNHSSRASACRRQHSICCWPTTRSWHPNAGLSASSLCRNKTLALTTTTTPPFSCVRRVSTGSSLSLLPRLQCKQQSSRHSRTLQQQQRGWLFSPIFVPAKCMASGFCFSSRFRPWVCAARSAHLWPPGLCIFYSSDAAAGRSGPPAAHTTSHHLVTWRPQHRQPPFGPQSCFSSFSPFASWPSTCASFSLVSRAKVVLPPLVRVCFLHAIIHEKARHVIVANASSPTFAAKGNYGMKCGPVPAATFPFERRMSAGARGATASAGASSAVSVTSSSHHVPSRLCFCRICGRADVLCLSPVAFAAANRGGYAGVLPLWQSWNFNTVSLSSSTAALVTSADNRAPRNYPAYFYAPSNKSPIYLSLCTFNPSATTLGVDIGIPAGAVTPPSTTVAAAVALPADYAFRPAAGIAATSLTGNAVAVTAARHAHSGQLCMHCGHGSSYDTPRPSSRLYCYSGVSSSLTACKTKIPLGADACSCSSPCAFFAVSSGSAETLFLSPFGQWEATWVTSGLFTRPCTSDSSSSCSSSVSLASHAASSMAASAASFSVVRPYCSSLTVRGKGVRCTGAAGVTAVATTHLRSRKGSGSRRHYNETNSHRHFRNSSMRYYNDNNRISMANRGRRLSVKCGCSKSSTLKRSIGGTAGTITGSSGDGSSSNPVSANILLVEAARSRHISSSSSRWRDTSTREQSTPDSSSSTSSNTTTHENRGAVGGGGGMGSVDSERGSSRGNNSPPSVSSSSDGRQKKFTEKNSSSTAHPADCMWCPVSQTPPSPSPAQLLRALLPCLWPPTIGGKMRVCSSVFCLFAAKLATVQAPLLLASLVDYFQLPLAAAGGLDVASQQGAAVGVDAVSQQDDSSSGSTSSGGSIKGGVSDTCTSDVSTTTTSNSSSSGGSKTNATDSSSGSSGSMAGIPSEPSGGGLQVATTSSTEERERLQAVEGHAAAEKVAGPAVTTAALAAVPLGIVCGFPLAKVCASGGYFTNPRAHRAT